MEKIVDKVKIECTRGDITSQEDMTAIVNAANAELKTGGGVAGAIHKAAGPELARECEPMAPINPGEAVISGGYDLPNEYVIHCLGPVYGRDKPEDKLLAKCYQNSLNLAEKKGIDSIAFPAISTGAFGYPTEKAAKVAFETILELTKKLENTKIIRFVLWGQESFEIHKKVLQNQI